MKISLYEQGICQMPIFRDGVDEKFNFIIYSDIVSGSLSINIELEYYAQGNENSRINNQGKLITLINLFKFEPYWPLDMSQVTKIICGQLFYDELFGVITNELPKFNLDAIKIEYLEAVQNLKNTENFTHGPGKESSLKTPIIKEYLNINMGFVKNVLENRLTEEMHKGVEHLEELTPRELIYKGYICTTVKINDQIEPISDNIKSALDSKDKSL